MADHITLWGFGNYSLFPVTYPEVKGKQPLHGSSFVHFHTVKEKIEQNIWLYGRRMVFTKMHHWATFNILYVWLSVKKIKGFYSQIMEKVIDLMQFSDTVLRWEMTFSHKTSLSINRLCK